MKCQGDKCVYYKSRVRKSNYEQGRFVSIHECTFYENKYNLTEIMYDMSDSECPNDRYMPRLNLV